MDVARDPMPPLQFAALSFALIGPPLAAFLQQQVAYALVAPACRGHAMILLHLPALAALGIVGLAMLFCLKERRRGGETALFVAPVGLLMSGIALALILAQWLPTLFLDPCQRSAAAALLCAPARLSIVQDCCILERRSAIETSLVALR